MQSSKKIVAVIIILVLGNLFFASFSITGILKQRQLEQTVQSQQINSKVLIFAKLFLIKVLRSEGEITFDDRLELENSVRAINNKEIFSAWQAFTKAKDQVEVQQKYYDLFNLLL